MVSGTGTVAFDLPEPLAAKADPALIGADQEHFHAIAASLAHSLAQLSDRLEAARKAPGRSGQQALERDREIHRLTARLRLLRRFGLDLCLGRMVFTGDTAGPDGQTTLYVGRLGLKDPQGRALLIDWRSPAAEPFFGATHATPMGLASRRRYRWTRGRITDYWDEVFTADGLTNRAGLAALDDQSAFIASLGGHRTGRMRDVLGTIQADQDAIIRAGSRGALVVDGGPGTGKTVVALHRTAYLLYADPRLGHRRGGVLLVGPHAAFLDYVADVLPSLGEDGVLTCTLADLVPEGASAVAEADPQVSRLKSTAAMVGAIEPAARFYEEAPTEPVIVETEWAPVRLFPDDWARAFAAPEPGTPHNEARDAIWEELVTIVAGHLEDDVLTFERIRAGLARNDDLLRALNRAWPTIEAPDLVSDLWTVPAYLHRCAPWLTREEIRRLQRPDGQAWTTEDLPLLDAARERLGDPQASRRARRREAEAAAARREMGAVVDHAIAGDDSELQVMSMLRGADLQHALVDEDALREGRPDRLAGPFAHIVVDEAQELTDAQWQMLLARCPSRSFTIVGDRAQARHGFTDTWPQRLRRIGLDRFDVSTLNINYRTPAEVMAEAEPVIRAAVPDANVPTSIRRTGIPVAHAAVADRDRILDAWASEHPEGIACVIGDRTFPDRPRIRSLTAELAKGLEFDLVVLVDPEAFGDGIEGAVDRYVAMTRTTGRLVILRDAPGTDRLGRESAS